MARSSKSLSTAAVLLVASSLCSSNVMGFAPQQQGGVFGVVSSSTELFLKRGGRPRGPVRTIEQKPPMNAEIKFEELRVTALSSNGKDQLLGVMSKSDALAKAKEMGDLDLILINANTDPPVCKIADYSKYRYLKEKKAKEVKKTSKASELKEVKMSYNIGDHDYDVRKKNASKFIEQGNRVKCTVVFKGREVQHDKIGVQLLQRLADDLSDICSMEGKPRREGRFLACNLTPRQEVFKQIGEKKRAAEKEKRKQKEEKKKEKAAVAAATGVATFAAVDDEDESPILDFEEDDDDDDESPIVNLDEDDDDDDDDDASLDDLLGGDDLTDDLFS